MSIEVQSVQSIRAFSEATFGADSSGSAGSFTYLPIIEGSATMELKIDELDPGQLVQHIDDGRKRVLGKRSATLSMQMNIAPTGTIANNGTTSVTSGLGLMLKAVMGGEALGEGSVAAGGSTAIVINVSTGDGAQWASGKLMGWVNSAGIAEWREVESVSTDAVTLKRGFSGAPSTSDPLYNASTYYMTANPSESLAFIVEGLESDDRWLLTGGQATGGMTIAVDLTGGQLPRITFSLSFADWFASDETSSDLTGALAPATYSAYNPIVGEAGSYDVWDVGLPTFSTTQAIHVSALAFEPHIAFAPYTSPSGTNTVERWVKTRNPDSPVQGQWTTGYESTAWWNTRKSRSDIAQAYTAGITPGSTVVLSVPTTQILNPQRAADASGLAAQVIQWKGRRDEDAGASTNDLAKSPFRIHLG